ncbi:MAG: ComEC/Rec2 family competence protein [Pseudomonadota bacterium]
MFKKQRAGWQALRILQSINATLQGQRGALLPWCPVFMGLGVAWYFSQQTEPQPLYYAVCLLALIAAALAALRWREMVGPLALAAMFFAIGAGLAGLRAHLVAGPVLDGRYYGAIEGTVVAVDRSASNALRVTLADVTLEWLEPRNTPRRVRVSLFGEQTYITPEPGARIMMTGHLSPPGGPAEPGGFDFQRHAWHLSIGGQGYTRSPALLLAPRPDGAHGLTHLRLSLSRAIQDRIDGQAGAFAAAVTTGDRSGLSPDTLASMRGSNIAHLLAISGLHMGLLTGFVFASLRIGLAAVSVLALRFPIRKWAAAGAMAAGAFYLALSGGNVATERAFIQVAVMLAAVMLDRRAITLRSVAIAAIIVLARRPETLLSPGFQMSFAATAALVAAFEQLRGASWLKAKPLWQRWIGGLTLSSVVAGAATAPFSAAVFNIMASYGLAANLISVPIMGSLVIPAAVVAGCLAPFGLEAPALWVMEQGLTAILMTSETVVSWPGAVRPIVSPPQGLIAAIVLGGLWVIIWRGRLRWIGAIPVGAALAIWPLAERPAVLISASGGLVGTMAPDGRALSRARGDGFAAGIWLENDGDGADQRLAASRPGWREDGPGWHTEWAGTDLWHGTGRRAEDAVVAACARHDVVVVNIDPPDNLAQGPLPALWPLRAEPCLLITPATLSDTGSLAVYESGRIETARGAQGARLWSDAGVRASWGYQ